MSKFFFYWNVKWALGNITKNKASGDDEIPAELFQILKDDAIKVLHSICQQIWKTQQWPQDSKRSVSFQSQKGQCQRMFKLQHNCTLFTCEPSNAQNSRSKSALFSKYYWYFYGHWGNVLQQGMSVKILNSNPL